MGRYQAMSIQEGSDKWIYRDSRRLRPRRYPGLETTPDKRLKSRDYLPNKKWLNKIYQLFRWCVTITTLGRTSIGQSLI